MGPVEIYFGYGRDQPYAAELNFRSSWNYEAMQKTVLDLGQHIEFRDISGEWFQDIQSEPFPYSQDVFKVLEQKPKRK